MINTVIEQLAVFASGMMTGACAAAAAVLYLRAAHDVWRWWP